MTHPRQPALNLIDSRRQMAAVLPALRQQILNRLHSGPASATALARHLRLPRQKVNYHVRELERAGFLELDGETQRRGCTERSFRPTARAYLIHPDLLGKLGADPSDLRDQFSSAYLMALAARVVRDVARLRTGADEAKKSLATLALEVDVRFRSPADRTAFAEELACSIAHLAAKYQNDSPESRPYRFVVGGHPVPKQSRKGEARHERAKS